MSDEESGVGRSRGFGPRGRAQYVEGGCSLGGDEGDQGDGNDDEDDNGGLSAQRGRGGRPPPVPQLRTIPGNVPTVVGEGGTQVRVMANYFKLNTPSNVVVYQYHVDFEPNVESARLRRGMIYEQKDKFGSAYIFDGQSNLKSTTKLGEETQLTVTRKSDNEPVIIRLRSTGEIGWGHHEMMRLYNTQMRRNLRHLKYILVGRNFFDPRGRHKLPEYKIELWQGILTAIHEYDSGIMMVCDSLHKVIRSDTVYEILQEVLRRDRSVFQDNARKELSGAIVMTSYNNRTYKIDDIAFDMNPLHVFERKSGSITIKDYYKQQYDITIKDERQPLIKCLPSLRDERVGRTEPILLVPELCAMTGLTESLKTNFEVKKQMGNLTRADPMRRVQNLYQFIQQVNSNEEVRREMSSWGLQFDNNVVEFNARVLAGEKIYMKNDDENSAAQYVQTTGDFTREIRGKPMKVPVRIPDWAIIVTQRDRQIMDDFAGTLHRVCGPLGIQLNRPIVQVLDNDRTGTFVDACKRVPPNMKIVVVIVPNNNKDKYDTIKKIFCCEHPVASQVVVSRTLAKGKMLMSVCTKIGIQMAVKLGAEAWALHVPSRSLMVVGYDTYHDSTMKNKSVGGFVCSLNPTLTRWYSRVAYHAHKEELSSNFSVNFAHGLKYYHSVNGRLPERVVVYRDGVGEGQIPHVFEVEVPQIKDAIKKVAGTETVRLAFIIVTKRVNARLFAKVAENRFENPIPGTIVDQVVTRKERYDFYLISQSVRQGTVSPTMYNIIEDETNWRPAHHQQLSYKLTHLYYNWMGTISVPAPCQYAHKLAYLTGSSLHREPNVRLADTLFYI